MTVALEVRGLTVRRGRRTVLSDVSFDVGAGDGVRLAGANGSGKTSLLRVLAGLTHPRAGTVARQGSCAFVPEKVTLAPALRGGEWLDAMRGLRRLGPVDWSRAVVASGLDASALRRPAAALSKGMQQRIALLESIESDCALLLLDEPFSGLDDDGRAWLGERIGARMSGGAAVLLTDHSGAAADRVPLAGVLLLRDGACERGGPPAEGADLGGASDPLGSGRDVARGARSGTALRVLASHPDGRRLERVVAEGASDDLLRELLSAGWHVEEVRS